MASKVTKNKHKTHKGTKKRMSVTASGLIKRKRAGLGHKCDHMTRKRKRQLRRPGYLVGSIAKTYAKLLGAD